MSVLRSRIALSARFREWRILDPLGLDQSTGALSDVSGTSAEKLPPHFDPAGDQFFDWLGANEEDRQGCKRGHDRPGKHIRNVCVMFLNHG
jgi:hypothetical protein